MAEFSFPRVATEAISARILERARQPNSDNFLLGNTLLEPTERPQVLETSRVGELIVQGRKKATKSGWPHFSASVRRQPRVNELMFGILGELTELLGSLNTPLRRLEERIEVAEQEAIVTREQSRRAFEDKERSEALGGLWERVMQDMQRQLEEQFAALRNALDAIEAKLPGRVDRFDELYFEFEEKFRGSEEVVRDRLSVYLPYLEKRTEDRQTISVLDLGCGRGEWLSLLQAHGFRAQGIDMNERMVARCISRGLEVVRGDLLDHLREQKDQSVSVITAFHVVEHLRFDQLIEVTDQTLRVLIPNGMAIFETPNPDGILASARSFYLDPTHNKPLPRQLFQFLLESRGFPLTEVLELQPAPAAAQFFSKKVPELASALNAVFYGAQDYGIIGWKAS